MKSAPMNDAVVRMSPSFSLSLSPSSPASRGIRPWRGAACCARAAGGTGSSCRFVSALSFFPQQGACCQIDPLPSFLVITPQ